MKRSNLPCSTFIALALLLSCLSYLISIPKAEAKLLDKIMAVFDDKIITLSEVNQIKSNATIRKQIAPQIYYFNDFSPQEVVASITQTLLIRGALGDSGIIISDNHVESEIKSTEKRLQLDRESLLTLLHNSNTSFEEYFEITRAAIEYDAFKSIILTPLISITEQNIKNTFYKQYSSKQTLSFRYDLIAYSIEKSKLNSNQANNLKDAVSQYQKNGLLPEELRDLSVTDLGNISEDGLTPEMVALLKNSDEGSISDPIVVHGQYQLFFIKSKNLVESDIYLKNKERIERELFEKEAQQVLIAWLEREKQKHFIEYFFETLSK
ncbi:MAG: hypothetical protein HQK50_16675 [Oligoflexia bacterium]|nr:hypothetical protein [Oligoflexia bacterium]MBF0367213.1 hypothetical protein [Oligoflexia bacterium]